MRASASSAKATTENVGRTMTSTIATMNYSKTSRGGSLVLVSISTESWLFLQRHLRLRCPGRHPRQHRRHLSRQAGHHNSRRCTPALQQAAQLAAVRPSKAFAFRTTTVRAVPHPLSWTTSTTGGQPRRTRTASCMRASRRRPAMGARAARQHPFQTQFRTRQPKETPARGCPSRSPRAAAVSAQCPWRWASLAQCRRQDFGVR
mmetsp:Transcript_36896/g.86206  ORF Transcript_36896/g.86206 Transcript_36896/m.86206 type:complete len:204 (+) Transcript_36896:307-918(+)